MKCVFLFLVLSLTTSAFASDCRSEGAQLSEQWVRENTQMRFGSVKIEANTKSSASNIYTNDRIICHHTTVYTFEAVSPTTGKLTRYIGHSVMNNEGLRPFPPTLSEVKDI